MISIVDARNDKHDFANKPEKYDYMYTEVECVYTKFTSYMYQHNQSGYSDGGCMYTNVRMEHVKEVSE